MSCSGTYKMTQLRDEIEHSGTVVGVGVRSLQVEITTSSACASCNAAKMCNAAESKQKIVEVIPTAGRTYEVGDTVVFVGSSAMEGRAVLIAYVCPLLLMLVGMVLAHLAGASDAVKALCAIVPLPFYYIALKLLRPKIDKQFIFKTKP